MAKSVVIWSPMCIFKVLWKAIYSSAEESNIYNDNEQNCWCPFIEWLSIHAD